MYPIECTSAYCGKGYDACLTCRHAAKQMTARINRNVADFMADRIDKAEFDARQRAVWDEIEKAGPEVKADVLRAIRQRLPTPARCGPNSGRGVRRRTT